MADKDYKAILAPYGFKDKYGHPLEKAADYLELLAELERLREQARVNQVLHRESDSDPLN